MTSLESWILSYLLNSVWQIPLLFLFGWVAARLLGKVATRFPHRVWVTVMLLQVFLPVLSSLSRNWFTILIDLIKHPRNPGAAHVFVTVGTASALNSYRVPKAFLALIVLAYLGTCTFFGVKLIWNLFRLSRLRRSAVLIPASEDRASAWNDFDQQLARQGVAIATSTQIFGPVTIGVRHKLVLVPPNITNLCQQQDLAAIIAHEFAHIDRNDFLKNLTYEILSLPAKYHPLFWTARELMIATREIVCDDIAAEVTGRKEYSSSLLRLAAVLLKERSFAIPYAIGVFDANALERRLMNLTQNQIQRTGTMRAAMMIGCIALGLITCGTALAGSMQVDASPTPRSETNRPQLAAGVAAGQKLSGDVPKYPGAAKKAKIQGKVLLKATIGEDGKIEALSLISGPSELRHSAWDAVRTWTYTPYLLNGKPTAVDTTITVTYTIGD